MSPLGGRHTAANTKIKTMKGWAKSANSLMLRDRLRGTVPTEGKSKLPFWKKDLVIWNVKLDAVGKKSPLTRKLRSAKNVLFRLQRGFFLSEGIRTEKRLFSAIATEVHKKKN